jgi:hypothetical protein
MEKTVPSGHACAAVVVRHTSGCYFGFSARVTPGITFGKPFPSKLSFR